MTAGSPPRMIAPPRHISGARRQNGTAKANAPGSGIGNRHANPRLSCSCHEVRSDCVGVVLLFEADGDAGSGLLPGASSELAGAFIFSVEVSMTLPLSPILMNLGMFGL